jgi:hypothetical protein
LNRTPPGLESFTRAPLFQRRTPSDRDDASQLASVSKLAHFPNQG